jgi:hypothetical protein
MHHKGYTTGVSEQIHKCLHACWFRYHTHVFECSIYLLYEKKSSFLEEFSETILQKYANHPLFLSDVKETLVFLDRFSKKYSKKKFENPSRGSRVVPCERTDMTKLKQSSFRNFANVPKNPITTKKTHTLLRPVRDFIQVPTTFIITPSELNSSQFFCTQDVQHLQVL